MCHTRSLLLMGKTLTQYLVQPAEDWMERNGGAYIVSVVVFIVGKFDHAVRALVSEIRERAG